MNQKMIWAVTAGVAVLMLAVAAIYARQRAVEAPAVVTTQTPAPETIAIAPVGLQPSITPKTAPLTEQATEPAPLTYDEVQVDLSRIAGKLQMSSPGITATSTGELPRYPLEMTCYRRNASPALNWHNAPPSTKSYVLVLERRALGEKASWTWIVYNIPATTSALASNLNKDTIGANGMFGTNKYDKQAYIGPCEPKGIYPYVLRLFALDTMLDVKAGAGMSDLLPLINTHIKDAAEIHTNHYLQM